MAVVFFKRLAIHPHGEPEHPDQEDSYREFFEKLLEVMRVPNSVVVFVCHKAGCI